MSTFVRGYTWTDGDAVTAARLNLTGTPASVSGLAQADFASGYSVVTIGDNAPGSPVEGTLWFDTSPGTGEGVLRAYNGAHFIPVGRGFLGYNTSGSTIDAGMIVKSNPAVGGTGDFRYEITATTSRHDIIAGMALGQITNGSTGVVINQGRVLNLLTTGTITAGDPVVPSTTTGKATTGADANYGKFYGSGVAGIFTKSGSGSNLEATLFPAPYATGWSFRAPTRLVNHTFLAGQDNTWSGSFGTPVYATWSVTPPGVIARLVTMRFRDVAATATVQGTIAIRQAGSGETVANGCAQYGGAFITDNGSSTDAEWKSASLIVMTNPAGDGTDRAEFLATWTGTVTNGRLEVWERAVLCGGRVV